MPKSEASELTDDEGQVGGVQSIQKKHEEGDPGGRACEMSIRTVKDSEKSVICRWLEPMNATQKENDSTDNTLGLKLGNMWVYKMSEKRSVKITRGCRQRKERRRKASGWEVWWPYSGVWL